MSNLLPNPYNDVPGSGQGNIRQGPQPLNHSQPFGHVPFNQLPPGILKQDQNSNSPLHTQSPVLQNSVVGHVQNVNNYNQSGNSSPAFNHPGIISPPKIGIQPLPIKPPLMQNPLLPTSTPLSSASQRSANGSNSSPYLPNTPATAVQPHQINASTPPMVPSSHYNKPLSNGPMSSAPGTFPIQPFHQSIVTSNQYSVPLSNTLPISAANFVPISGNSPGPMGPPLSKPSFPVTSQPGMLNTGMTISGPPRNSPQMTTNVPPMSGPPTNRPATVSQPSGLNSQIMSGPPSGPSQQPGINGPGIVPGQTMSSFQGPPMGRMPPSGVAGPPVSGPPMNLQQPHSALQANGPPVTGQYNMPPAPPTNLSAPQSAAGNLRMPGPPPGSQGLPPGPPAGPISPPSSNMQSRYPQMPPSNYPNRQQSVLQQPAGTAYPQQYSTQGVTQQMGQLSVTKQGFDQLWGHQMVDLLQSRHILPEYPEDPPEIKLGQPFADAPNCSPELFRCTVNRIPESNSLLQKSRLPLGILIHPFKDLNHLPVIQCTTIVRCRACRTYINPFVYFVDSKRWKCNLCYRVNDLPEEFQYDPVSKSYGDPSRRPEIKSATIEFIAPGEYMLRPPQPAVYLFLLDVSQIARESGYLQVFCETLKSQLDHLPGDARTQVGFICFDSHVHYYLMRDGLTRPKEMTILDIDDVFLPSPESLLVNLGERRELITELLTLLPQRFSTHGVPASALGAALQAAYKLMAPTGGRITVFQTCLPNVGPGALQPREDPNARSAKEVAHLNPATDFYKRLALDCSGAQIAVDLFLLNSQYSDLATLSGMSKFSGGSVYHVPLFRAAREPHAARLTALLTRYLSRKIGFEAVMRVRCTRGISIHTFHGNFFVRSTDLLSLPNISPDAGFGMQLAIDESLSDLQQVCFQAALLYTSSKGERRIRVHTLALPIATTLPDVLHSADQQCIIGLLSKMAVDRCSSASMSEAREALSNVCVDALAAHRLAHNLPAPATSSALLAPHALRLLPLYIAALLKKKAFRVGTSTRLDDRVFDMCELKSQPLAQLLRATYPDLYPVHALYEHRDPHDREQAPDPPRLHLTAERINSNGAYLLDDGDTMILYVGHAVSPAFLSETFGVTAFSQLPDEARSLPGGPLLQAFIDKLNEDRPCAADLLILRDNSPSRQLFTDRLVDDRIESTFSYYEFLQHIKSQVK